jgi:hypothetical protein
LQGSWIEQSQPAAAIEAVVATARSSTRSRRDAKDKHNLKESNPMSSIKLTHKPADTNNGSDTDVNTLIIESLSDSTPFNASDIYGETAELSIIGHVEFEDFLESVAALRQKRTSDVA